MDEKQFERLRAGFCIYCEKGPFVVVAQHMRLKHGVVAAELREDLGLNRTARLVSDEHHARFREIAKERLARPGEAERLAAIGEIGRAQPMPTYRPQAMASFRAAYERNPESYHERIKHAQDVSATCERSEKQKAHAEQLKTLGNEWREAHPEEARDYALAALEKAVEWREAHRDEARDHSLAALEKAHGRKVVYSGGLSRPQQKARARRVVAPGFPREEPFTTWGEAEEYLAGETIVCLLCGRSMGKLGNHLKSIHGVSVEEYRVRYNISAAHGLTSRKTAAAYAQAVRTWRAERK